MKDRSGLCLDKGAYCAKMNVWYNFEMKNSLSRRNFVKGLTSVGALVAVSKLPAFADDPSVFPGRGKWERLVLAYNHIDAGATKPFSILHISDTHFTEAYPHEDPRSLELKRSARRLSEAARRKRFAILSHGQRTMSIFCFIRAT